jgi:predicted membrane-bound mannosyltransferase
MSSAPPGSALDLDAQLREKITSKMTVATFLAGFTFAALSQLLNDPARLSSAPSKIAILSLTTALALFVAAVYMYDRLSMPREKWNYKDPTNPQVPAESNAAKALIEKLHFKVHDRERMGIEEARYTYMIDVWQWVFTPAVIFALVGFCAILYGTRDGLIFWLGLSVIIAVMIYYIIVRPNLGEVD